MLVHATGKLDQNDSVWEKYGFNMYLKNVAQYFL